MRNLLMAVVVLGLVAAPSLGVVNVSLTADNVNLAPGQTTTVHVLAQGTASGLFSLGGNINASGASVLTSNAGSFAWVSTFSPTFGLTPKPGLPGTNGGWTLFGSEQTNYLTPDATYAKAALTEVASYTVTAGSTAGSATLAFVGASVSGYKPLETDKTGVMGQVANLTINVTPEPVTMALLALGGLLVARRRR